MLNKYGYSDMSISDTLRFKNGSRKISFRFDLLNKDEIKIDEVKCRNAVVSFNENRAVMRSAVFDIDANQGRDINFLSDMIRPWFVLEMPPYGHTLEWPLGVFILGSPELEIEDGSEVYRIGAYDKTVIFEEDRFTERFYISKGTSYVSTIERILNTSGVYRSHIEQSDYIVQDDMEYPAGIKKSSVINKLLREINYTPVFADEEGVINAMSYVMPSDRKVNISYSSKKDKVIYPKLEKSFGMTGTPNVFTRTAFDINGSAITSTYENNDPMSPVSTICRGRKIVDFAEVDNIFTQDVLDVYVKRIAAEKISAYDKLSFTTVLMPEHGMMRTLFLDIPEILTAPGKFWETSWEMDLRFNGKMTHKALRVSNLRIN